MIFITKAGLVDDFCMKYLHGHLKQILGVILNDEVKLEAYSGETNRILLFFSLVFQFSLEKIIFHPFPIVWSIIDSFEWAMGYTLEYFTQKDLLLLKFLLIQLFKFYSQNKVKSSACMQ